MADCPDDCPCNNGKYQGWLAEAEAFVAHPPTTPEERDAASQLEERLGYYCNDHGLGEPWELYQLRELLK